MARKDRRRFLTGVLATGAATAVAPAVRAQEMEAAQRAPSALPPTTQVAALETQTPGETPTNRIGGVPGSDFMVDVLKTLNIKYCPANCASSYRGIHESLIDYGGNKMPEFLTCMHEESAVAMGHGYFKVAGKPLMTLCHGTVGLQHATMGIYNAWCDRVPVIVIGGNDLDAAHRPPGVPTFHAAQDIGLLVRDYTKWDDTPVSLQHFAQSMVRAYKIAMTPPYGPVLISLDAGLQQEAIREHGQKLYIPKYVPTSPPQGDSGAVKEAARLLAAADNPVIVADRAARTPNGIKLLVQLAELLQARVIDQGSRVNFPKTHYLSAPATQVASADVILGLELSDSGARSTTGPTTATTASARTSRASSPARNSSASAARSSSPSRTSRTSSASCPSTSRWRAMPSQRCPRSSRRSARPFPIHAKMQSRNAPRRRARRTPSRKGAPSRPPRSAGTRARSARRAS